MHLKPFPNTKLKGLGFKNETISETQKSREREREDREGVPT